MKDITERLLAHEMWTTALETMSTRIREFPGISRCEVVLDRVAGAPVSAGIYDIEGAGSVVIMTTLAGAVQLSGAGRCRLDDEAHTLTITSMEQSPNRSLVAATIIAMLGLKEGRVFKIKRPMRSALIEVIDAA